MYRDDLYYYVTIQQLAIYTYMDVYVFGKRLPLVLMLLWEKLIFLTVI